MKGDGANQGATSVLANSAIEARAASLQCFARCARDTVWKNSTDYHQGVIDEVETKNIVRSK